MSEWGIPALDPHRLGTCIPTAVYGGDPVTDPTHTLFLWRTARLTKAAGMVMCFYTSDDRLEALWRQPRHYIDLFLRHQIGVLIEPDFSLWTDDALIQQAFNIFRMRSLGCLWQSYGLSIIPNLAWSDERSFSFAFEGIPVGCPVAMTECRTAGSNDSDRRAFLAGISEAVTQIQPQNICIYGGAEHSFWLTGHLPPGPRYTLLESFMTVRSRIRARQERHERDRNQLDLFPQGGTTRWAGAEVQAA